MEKDNLESLQNAVKYAGFGEHLSNEIEQNMKLQKDKFALATMGEFGSSKVDYKLEFNQSEKNGRFYFNRYTATLKNENPELEKSQKFFVNAVMSNKNDSEEVKQLKRKANGVTAKEAFNLLQGRAVYKTLLNKEKEPYNAWIQLDFSKQDQYGNNETKKFTDRYGFDLNKTLDNYPIKGLDNPEKREQIVQSLEKGNRLQVTFEKEGKEEKMLIEAKPEFKNLDVYDSNFVKQRLGNVATRFTSENNSFSKSEGKEQTKSKETTEETSKEKNKKNERSQNSEDSEKKTSRRKSLGFKN